MTADRRASIHTVEGFRNHLLNIEGKARCAFMACESPQVEAYLRTSIGAVIDHVVAELMDIGADMDALLAEQSGPLRLNNP